MRRNKIKFALSFTGITASANRSSMCVSLSAFPPCIRPVIFENDDAQWRFSARGTCFLVTHENLSFAVTAKHIVRDYRPSQYRIPSRLGSHTMLPIRQPFTAELHREDFEDFVVVPIDVAEISGDAFDPADACQMDESAIQWSAIHRVVVFGFPSAINSVDYEQGLISIQPCGMVGRLTGRSIGDGMREIEFGGDGDLSSYDGFSGSPVFQVADSDSIGRLLGIVLRGSQDTSTSRRCHFLDVRVVAPLIRCHLRQQTTESNVS